MHVPYGSGARRSGAPIVVALLATVLLGGQVASGAQSVALYPDPPEQIEEGQAFLVRAFACEGKGKGPHFGADGFPGSADDSCQPSERTEWLLGDTEVLGFASGRTAIAAVIEGEGEGRTSLVARIKPKKGKKLIRVKERVAVVAKPDASEFIVPPAYDLSRALLPDRSPARLGVGRADAGLSTTDEESALTADEIEQLFADLIASGEARLLETEVESGTGEQRPAILLLCFDAAATTNGLPGFAVDGRHCLPHPGDVTWSTDGGVLLDQDGAVITYVFTEPGTGTLDAMWELGDRSGMQSATVEVKDMPGPAHVPGDADRDGDVDLNDLASHGLSLLAPDLIPPGAGDGPATTAPDPIDLVLTGRLLDDELAMGAPGGGNLGGDGAIGLADLGAIAALSELTWLDPQTTIPRAAGDLDGDGDIDADDVAVWADRRFENAMVVVRPEELTLLEGGRRSAEAWLCPGSLGTIYDDVDRLAGMRFVVSIGLDGDAGTGDDDCRAAKNAEWFVIDPDVASVSRPRGSQTIVAAGSPGKTAVYASVDRSFLGGMSLGMSLTVNEPPERDASAGEQTGNAPNLATYGEEWRLQDGDIIFIPVLDCTGFSGDLSECPLVDGIDELLTDNDGEFATLGPWGGWFGIQALKPGFDVIRAAVDGALLILSVGAETAQTQRDGFNGLSGWQWADVIQVYARRGGVPGDPRWDARADLDGNEIIDDADVAIANDRSERDSDERFEPGQMDPPPTGYDPFTDPQVVLEEDERIMRESGMYDDLLEAMQRTPGDE